MQLNRILKYNCLNEHFQVGIITLAVKQGDLVAQEAHEMCKKSTPVSHFKFSYCYL